MHTLVGAVLMGSPNGRWLLVEVEDVIRSNVVKAVFGTSGCRLNVGTF
jgi:hypothetical protein